MESYVHSVLSLPYFAWLNSSDSHYVVCISSSLSFYCSVIFNCMDVPQLFNSFINRKIFGSNGLLGYMINVCYSLQETTRLLSKAAVHSCISKQSHCKSSASSVTRGSLRILFIIILAILLDV